MKVILTQSIESLGPIGSEVKVADGYARNYLLPQGKAILATPQNIKLFERQRQKIQEQITRERTEAEELANRLTGVTVQISARVTEENRLYGSVTVRDILDALAQQGIDLDRRMVLLADPLKTTGTHKVAIRVFKNLEPEITVEITAE